MLRARRGVLYGCCCVIFVIFKTYLPNIRFMWVVPDVKMIVIMDLGKLVIDFLMTFSLRRV